MLNIALDERPETLLVKLEGRMDGSPGCASLKTVIRTAIEQGHRNFVFDLAEVVSMSSLGIGCLVASYVSIHNVDGSLVLRFPNEQVLHTLEVTRLLPGVFQIEE